MFINNSTDNDCKGIIVPKTHSVNASFLYLEFPQIEQSLYLILLFTGAMSQTAGKTLLKLSFN